MPLDLLDILDVEILLKNFLLAQQFDFVQPPLDADGLEIGLPRVYAGLENTEAQGLNPQGDPTLVDNPPPMESSESSIVRLPCIIAVCQDAAALKPEFRGNWEPEVEIQISSDVFDSTSGALQSGAHRKRVKQVLSVMITETIAEDISAFSSLLPAVFPNGLFSCAAVIFNRQRWFLDGGAYTSSLHFTLRQARLIPNPNDPETNPPEEQKLVIN